jgi:hypothetical protein
MKPLCYTCTWIFEPGEFYETITGDMPLTCMAFYPQPIPDEIKDGTTGHRVPHPAQVNDVVYAPQEKYKKP